MMRSVLFLSILLASGCVEGPFDPRAGRGNVQAAQPDPKAPPPGARTASAFDTTSAEERAQAVAEATRDGRETELGRTVASLGAVGDPGIWLRTPLVDAPARGRVAYPGKGTAVAVDLIPLDTAPGAGSRISLAAMRLIEADLTALPELRVYRVE